jgi:maltose alpha-D-glucosyltransferase / alpha-amylase
VDVGAICTGPPYAPQPGHPARLAPLLDNDQRKILLANALLYSLPGAPIIYYGDEIGMGDNIWLPDRNGVRTPMQWDSRKNSGFSKAHPEALYAPVIDRGEFSYKHVNVEDAKQNPNSTLNRMQHLVSVRKSNPVFAQGDYQFLAKDQTQCLTILRTFADEHVLCVLNLTLEPQLLKVDLSQYSGKKMVNLIDGSIYDNISSDLTHLNLRAYEFLWFQIE